MYLSPYPFHRLYLHFVSILHSDMAKQIVLLYHELASRDKLYDKQVAIQRRNKYYEDKEDIRKRERETWESAEPNFFKVEKNPV